MRKSEYIDYADLGFKALKRAAIRAAKEAQTHHLKIPVTRNGRIVYIFPEEIIEKNFQKIKKG